MVRLADHSTPGDGSGVVADVNNMDQPMLFTMPEMQDAFIVLYGADKPDAKFKLGQSVTFTKAPGTGPFAGQTFAGVVRAVNDTGTEDGFEYLIGYAPGLAWEGEMKEMVG